MNTALLRLYTFNATSNSLAAQKEDNYNDELVSIHTKTVVIITVMW